MTSALWAIAGTLIFLWVFWALYVLVMGIYRAHLKKQLRGLTFIMSVPLVAIGLAVDVFAQYTLACIFFLDLPRRGEHLVTARLQRYSAGSGWRKIKADWVCTHLLDVFDPHGDHC